MSKILVVFALLSSCLFGLCSCSKSPEESLSAAVLAAERNQWKDCRKHVEKALSGYPDHIGALLLRAVACEQLGDYEHAIDSAERAVKLNPESFAALYTLGRIYSTSELRRNDAVSPLLRAYNLKPQDTGTLILLCNAMSDINPRQAPAFLKLLEKKSDPKNQAAICNQFAVAYAKQGQLILAQQMFNRAYAAAPSDLDIMFNAARFYDRYNSVPPVARKLYLEFRNRASGQPGRAEQLAEADRRIAELP